MDALLLVTLDVVTIVTYTNMSMKVDADYANTVGSVADWGGHME